MAERQPSKLHVASSNLVSRSTDSTDSTDTSTAPGRLAATGLRLRAAIARTVPIDPGLTAAAANLSSGYRAGSLPAERSAHVHDARTAAAYAASRAPATFAASGKAMLEGARGLPDFAPRTLLDVGAGTGAAAWAATAIWPTLTDLLLVDREAAMVDLGRKLAADRDVAGTASAGGSALAAATWRTEALDRASFEPADLVSVAYVLGELPEARIAPLIARLWSATRGALVLVESGSPAGFARILAARSILIAEGAAIAAPCPGIDPCPVAGADWCHFLVRLERSRLHRRAKAATLSWEDEPFSYLVATRVPARPAPRVVLGRPRHRPGRVELRICPGAGRLDTTTLSRRDGAAFRAARDLEWGDRVPDAVAQPRGGPDGERRR